MLLDEVDAPESHHAFSAQAREHLATLCFGQDAELRPIVAIGGFVLYSRVVTHAACRGADARVDQVATGRMRRV